MARKFGIEIGGLDEGINLTPLLDVLFNLIFFFILATTIKDSEAYLDVTLPEAEVAGGEAEQAAIWTIVLTSDQTVYLNGEEMDQETLTTRLKEATDEEVEAIVVRGDTKTYHGTLVSTLDACARAGHTSVRIEVAPQE